MFNRLFVLIGLLMLFLAGIFYLVLGRNALDALVEQMLHREQLAVRAGASSLETFFSLFGRSVSIQSGQPDVINFSPNTGKVLDEFVKRWEGTPVAGVIVTGKDGRVKFNGNRKQVPEVGVDVSDRDYFLWAKTAKKGDVYISNPVVARLGAAKGKYIVVVASPLVSPSGEFGGVFAASVILDELKSQYLDPLKVTEKSFIYLVDANGDILISDQKGIWGKNLFREMAARPFLGSQIIAEKLKEILASDKEGKLDIAYPLDLTSYKPERILVAYAPAAIGENRFLLGIATPIGEAVLFLAPFYFKNLGITTLAFLGFLAIVVRIAKIISYEEAVKNEHKIHSLDGKGKI